MKTVIFKKWKCNVIFQKYQNNDRTAIELIHTNEGNPIAMATVNIPEYPLKENQILIKNWSENEGILEVLCKAGIIKDTGIIVPTGYVNANLCELLITA